MAVVLDANVFFHPPIRDLFLTGAWAFQLLEVRWSAEILAEVARNWARVTGTHDAEARWSRLEAALHHAFPDALVRATQQVESELRVAIEDRHVVGTALAAQATGIVTFNTRHFPAQALAGIGLRVWSPDLLCLDLYQTHPDRVLATLARQGALLSTRRTVQGTLAALERRCPRFVARVRAALGVS